MPEDRQYMGTADDAKAALIEKAKAWRETRQPLMATPREHREVEIREHQIRFELANAALLWLWHEEHPSPDSKLEAYRKALEEISKQLTMGELIAKYGEDYLGDSEAGYDAIIMVARKALAAGG